jgi:hypothetical protein
MLSQKKEVKKEYIYIYIFSVYTCRKNEGKRTHLSFNKIFNVTRIELILYDIPDLS